ncbi:prestin [Phlebotomus argentipes]|uniref:prestin n=1 Tax=Phlebotomus argentipes TaxID=94469 RepID=UPI002893411B|nr:prestin [Phlebotomus argentipes]XP_059608892.1 prestin [Phlebotomus argentipes]XP_059608893.1 prestin [Phlebotomus argentipes]
MVDKSQEKLSSINRDDLGYTTIPSYFISRQVLHAEEANKISGYEKERESYGQRIRQSLASIDFLALLYSLVPIVDWLPKYSFRQNLMGDITSGITVAVMHIPQGMAYAILAFVPPQIGLYMAFFPLFAYVIFGTSRHISMGTFAVISLMVGKVVQTHVNTEQLEMGHVANVTDGAADADGVAGPTAMEIVAATSLMVAIYQLIMSLLRMGALSSLLSEPLVSGFTTASAIHVVTSQLKDLFGIKLPHHKGAFKIVYIAIDLFQLLPSANVTAVTISLIVILFMIASNELLKPWLAKRCRIPAPTELIAVVGGTLASQLLNLEEAFHVKPVGPIPTGLPSPVLPSFDLLKLVAVDSVAIAIVSYSIVMSMALIFAKKHSYEVRANQELIAMSVSNAVGSLYSCIPTACSLSRSLIQEQTGGNTQLASVIAAALIAVVLLWIGPFFEALPRCVLAGIIVVALKGMLMQVRDLKRFFKEDRLEALTWICTFLSVVLIDIDIGLLVGIIMSIIALYLKGWKSYSCILGLIPGTGIYVDIEKHKTAEEVPSIKIFRHAGCINFASKASFKRKLYETIGVNSRKPSKAPDYHDIHTVVIDLSCIPHIDYSACKLFKEMASELDKVGIAFFLAAPSDRVFDTIMHADALGDGPFQTFPTVHDAVLFSQGKLDMMV